MGRRGIVTCAALFACLCAPAQAQLVYSADGRLYEIDADGSDRSLFTTPTSPNALDSEPAWSPDGTQLAVVHQRREYDAFDRTRIDILDGDGTSRRSVTDLGAGVSVSSPHWGRATVTSSRLHGSRGSQVATEARSSFAIWQRDPSARWSRSASTAG